MFEPTTLSSQRACGRRIAAGIYAETRLSPFGQPIETFILCPPKPIDIAAWGLTARGARLVKIDGIWHVFDIISKSDYHVADFIEETHCKGASRRLSSKLDFSKLSHKSRLVLIHEQAIIENYVEYPSPPTLSINCGTVGDRPPTVSCPRDIHRDQLEEMCAGLWWHDHAEPDLIPAGELHSNEDSLHYTRAIPGGVSYAAFPRPEGVEPIYQFGITYSIFDFLSLPISNLAVIAGRNPQEGEKAEKAFQAASMSGLPVTMEEE